MDSGPPFAVILFGQPSLRQRLRLGVLAALDQGIAVRYAIAGMSGADTADYADAPAGRDIQIMGGGSPGCVFLTRTSRCI